MNKIFLVFTICFLSLHSSIAQGLQEGQKRWSSESKLTIDDFKIKINDGNNEYVYSQFMISHAIGGFDFMKRNLNQKINNVFLGNASWIDTTKIGSLDKQLDFQQMQFDLSEIQARKFRKRVLIHKGEISKGFDIVNKINNDVMAEFSEIRIKFVNETESGRNEQQMMVWKEKIMTELKALNDFRYENTSKIKLPK